MPYRIDEPSLRTVPCRVCGSASNVVRTDAHVQAWINCIRWGDFRIIYNGVELPLKDDKLLALASYTLRSMQGVE
jgi:hypothetical protein